MRMAKDKIDKSGLTSAQTRRFKGVLLAKRNEILGNVTSMESEALRRDRSELSNMPTHMADIGTDNYEIDNVLGLMDSERKILAEIDDALRRIEGGTYGICEGGGEQIPRQRLDAIPWARYCVSCATLLEKGLLGGKDDNDDDQSYREEPIDET